ncbi:F-box/LRR-repeat protein 3-like isoform X1 [Trichogramma pretiosum]|uniref:F-box/LRR-repeat protein 3-like isoform X1 n=2 Tax=Trichogramma pretiosum TaxID=7493 RepID=UPI0006C9A091|nr:F-box/LRR-repeat protein 3-like isoform X1 [Trichogramma pretiosum]
MVAFINEDQSKFVDVDSDRFSTALNMNDDEDEDNKYADDESDRTTSRLLDSLCLDEPFFAVSAANESSTLQLAHVHKNTSRLSTKGILTLMNHCEGLRELSLSYSFLSEELLEALSSNKSSLLQLDTLRVEAHPDAKPASTVSCEAWCAFATHFSNINFILLAYLTEVKDYEALLQSYVPLTHLYFGEEAPSSAIARVGERCPRLGELVVGAYGPETADCALLSIARGCPKLTALGLGDCEITCSAFVEFVAICREHLQVLYVSDTSLIEDSDYDVDKVAARVSALLGRPWQPNYVPYW